MFLFYVERYESCDMGCVVAVSGCNGDAAAIQFMSFSRLLDLSFGPYRSWLWKRLVL